MKPIATKTQGIPALFEHHHDISYQIQAFVVFAIAIKTVKLTTLRFNRTFAAFFPFFWEKQQPRRHTHNIFFSSHFSLHWLSTLGGFDGDELFFFEAQETPIEIFSLLQREFHKTEKLFWLELTSLRPDVRLMYTLTTIVMLYWICRLYRC